MLKSIALLIIIAFLSACSGGSGSSEPEAEQVSREPELIQSISYLLGPHGWRGVQDFTYVNGELYTLHHSKYRTTINRFEGDDIAGYSIVGEVAGHQGLTHDGEYFWSTDYQLSGSVVKFSYEDGEELKRKGVYKLFNDNSASTTPAIGGDYLVATGMVNGLRVIRVWYVADFTEQGDYSYRYLYEFHVANSILQGIAVYGDKIWTISGFKEEEAKTLRSYTLSGNIINIQSITTGINGSGWYEPEGLSILNGNLVFAIVTGTAKDRSTSIYRL